MLIPCCATVKDINCTFNADCYPMYSECDQSISRCRCRIGFYDDGTNCQPSKMLIELMDRFLFVYYYNSDLNKSNIVGTLFL